MRVRMHSHLMTAHQAGLMDGTSLQSDLELAAAEQNHVYKQCKAFKRFLRKLNICNFLYIFPPLSVLTKTNLYLGLPAWKSGSALLMSSMLYF